MLGCHKGVMFGKRKGHVTQNLWVELPLGTARSSCLWDLMCPCWVGLPLGLLFWQSMCLQATQEAPDPFPGSQASPCQSAM